jgi:hypothetical protein
MLISAQQNEMVQMTDVAEVGAAPSETRLFDVEFLDLGTNETARFAVPGALELQRAWDMAYDELGEDRRESDALESRSGLPLAGDLSKTVRHIHEHIVPDLRFQIHREQGGA